MSEFNDSERLDFLIQKHGTLSSNNGTGYIYWYRGEDGYPIGRTKIVKGRTAREALDAAMQGERGHD